ncbi:hypothetical protein AZE42_13040 [Rhizopogon vesiculosus]|uniref:Uncharacterized protein n=1 Tax=Rhizopogon vesiculosus TaxID=180088 RepID=A0A1J8PQU0_9AGAM|nr:hypothetical protein AZE42_13040 [Rhizopogon vesiculosus]
MAPLSLIPKSGKPGCLVVHTGEDESAADTSFCHIRCTSAAGFYGSVAAISKPTVVPASTAAGNGTAALRCQTTNQRNYQNFPFV